MAQYTITKYNANSGRVYSMGSSSGAMRRVRLAGLVESASCVVWLR